MDLIKLHSITEKPAIYKKGNAVMWDDEHISKILLETHLSQDTDLASRRIPAITKTINWIINQSGMENADILDLGCGPGLYCERLIVIGTLIVAFATLALPFVQNLWVVSEIAVLIGIGNAMAISAATAVAAIEGREVVQGVVMGAFNTVTSMGITIPPLIFGFILVAAGINAIYIISAVVTLAALPVFWLLVIRSRKWIAARG